MRALMRVTPMEAGAQEEACADMMAATDPWRTLDFPRDRLLRTLRAEGRDDLARRGYSEQDIESAVSHIERTSLDVPGAFWSDIIPVHRAFSHEEATRLSTKVRGYLWRLKCRGVIDHALEDEIVQKAMNLEEPAGLREIKTVAALTVFGYEHKFQLEEDPAILPFSRIH